MTRDEPLRLAELTRAEWSEIRVLFEHDPEVLGLIKSLRLNNSLKTAIFRRISDGRTIERANRVLRHSGHERLSRVQIVVDPETEKKPQDKQILHLYKTGEGNPQELT